jgi:hypothetical protein
MHKKWWAKACHFLFVLRPPLLPGIALLRNLTGRKTNQIKTDAFNRMLQPPEFIVLSKSFDLLIFRLNLNSK